MATVDLVNALCTYVVCACLLCDAAIIANPLWLWLLLLKGSLLPDTHPVTALSHTNGSVGIKQFSGVAVLISTPSESAAQGLTHFFA